MVKHWILIPVDTSPNLVGTDKGETIMSDEDEITDDELDLILQKLDNIDNSVGELLEDVQQLSYRVDIIESKVNSLMGINTKIIR